MTSPHGPPKHGPPKHGPLKIGIGGPVGAGKTTLTAALARALKDQHSLAVITNDIYTQEDAEALMRMQILPADRVMGVETGGCPHTAIREDASINLAAVAELRARHPDLELIRNSHGPDRGISGPRRQARSGGPQDQHADPQNAGPGCGWPRICQGKNRAGA